MARMQGIPDKMSIPSYVTYIRFQHSPMEICCRFALIDQ
jgi:hypothetical protein